MGLWTRLRERSLRRIKLVRMIDAKNSEILGIYAISSLFPLDNEERQRLRQLAKHIKWLHRIYKGMWPWGLDI